MNAKSEYFVFAFRIAKTPYFTRFLCEAKNEAHKPPHTPLGAHSAAPWGLACVRRLKGIPQSCVTSVRTPQKVGAETGLSFSSSHREREAWFAHKIGYSKREI